MKRLIALLLCLLFLLCSCGKPDIEKLPDTLLSVDGAPILTREDLRFAAEYESEPDTEFLFLRLAEQALLTFLAEQEGESENLAAIEAEYEIYLENLSLYGQQASHDALRSSFADLSDGEFRTLFINYLYRSASADSLLKSIAAVYGNIADPQTIREGIVENLCEMLSFYDVSVSYPGLEDHFFLFDHAL